MKKTVEPLGDCFNDGRPISRVENVEGFGMQIIGGVRIPNMQEIVFARDLRSVGDCAKCLLGEQMLVDRWGHIIGVRCVLRRRLAGRDFVKYEEDLLGIPKELIDREGAQDFYRDNFVKVDKNGDPLPTGDAHCVPEAEVTQIIWPDKNKNTLDGRSFGFEKYLNFNPS
jgi:hypothetical protein